jgi:CobQ-like glutamine amidotransferase family enzyme
VSADTLRLVHLYPEQLGVSGDRGNVTTLVARARRAGLETEVVEYRVGDDVPTVADVVLLGHGPLSGVRSVSADAQRLLPALEGFAASGVPVIGVGGGMELLTKGVVTDDGETVPGIGFFDALVRRGAPRRTNYFQVTTTYLGDELTLFGFEDHAAHLELGAGVEAFGHVVHGGGNGSAGVEGVVRGASFGTQLKGPLLPLNPALSDRVLRAALTRRSISYHAGEAHAKLDEYAAQSQRVIRENLERSFKAM